MVRLLRRIMVTAEEGHLRLRVMEDHQCRTDRHLRLLHHEMPTTEMLYGRCSRQ